MNKSRLLFSPNMLWKAAVCLAGGLLVLYGYRLSHWRDQQVDYFNQGLAAYQAQQFDQATALFDQSIDIYKNKADGKAPKLLWYVSPVPDRRLASRAAFQKAKALVKLKNNGGAVDSYKDALRLNSGNGHETGQFDDATTKQITALTQDAKFCDYDYELLLKNDPSQAQAQGKSGKGKGQKQKGSGKGKGKQKGQEGDGEGQQKGPQPMPGQQQKSNQPGGQPGKGPKTTI